MLTVLCCLGGLIVLACAVLVLNAARMQARASRDAGL